MEGVTISPAAQAVPQFVDPVLQGTVARETHLVPVWNIEIQDKRRQERKGRQEYF